MEYGILVVDDDETVSCMTGMMLRQLGYQPIVFNDPVQALAVFSEMPERIDGAILDEMMPRMRGTDLAKQMLRIKDDLPIVLMTGHGDIVPVEEVKQSGVRLALTKPVEKARLKQALEEVFGN